ncbi:hypothetical protein [Enhygromyxa salina]|uniref:Uncharacterized protein n=1 Tax=Enhygromyxa salina TaxID=215803 RepID=A0A2S9XPQ7_9BACT|nr:hypothetical protein [Enhygromyxa salina]PRP94844.1 hypothetical protein ENSA7_76670 [Enhygromyxa salina]
MATVKYKAGDRVTMTVTRADNVLLGYLAESTNVRRKIYERMTDYDARFQDEIDLTPSFRSGNQDMLVTAINCSSAGHVEFLIEVNGKDQYRVSETLGQNKSKSWHVNFQKS